MLRRLLKSPALSFPSFLSVKSILALFVCAFVVHFTNIVVKAELPLARLSTVFPNGGKIGGTVEVTIAGTDLDDVIQLLFTNPEIKSSPKTKPSTITNQPPEIETNRFLVTIPDSVPEGAFEVRASGRFGASTPRMFFVSHSPELVQNSTNHTAADAALIDLETVVNARAKPNEADFYRFKAVKGKRVLAHCIARTADSRMEPVMVLTDATGHEFARSRTGDPIDFTPSSDGEFVLSVADNIYRGGDEYFYRVCVSSRPQIDFITPPAGTPGTRQIFTIHGRNLPNGQPVPDQNLHGKSIEKLEVEIEVPTEKQIAQRSVEVIPDRVADAVLDQFEYRLETPQGISNPIRIGLTKEPLVAAAGTNHSASTAQRIQLPCEVYGQFRQQGLMEWFEFEAKKGATYSIEIFSHRLGARAKPLLFVGRVNTKTPSELSDSKEIYEGDGNFGGPEFDTSTQDLAMRYEIKEDGLHRIMARNLFNHSSDTFDPIYRLSVRMEKADFRLMAVAEAPPNPNKDAKDLGPWTLFLRKDSVVPVRVFAFRRHGFTGEIQLEATNLPPGVTSIGGDIESGVNFGRLMLTASKEIGDWTGAIEIIGRAKVGENVVEHRARQGVMLWSVGNYTEQSVPSRLTTAFVAATSSNDVAPLSIRVPKFEWEVGLTGKVSIPIEVVRNGEANNAFKLKAVGSANQGAFNSVKEIDVDAKATNVTAELDLAKLKLTPGIHFLHFEGQTQAKFRIAVDSLKAAEDAAKQIEADTDTPIKSAAAAADERKKTKEAVTKANEALKKAEEALKASKPNAESKPKEQETFEAAQAAQKSAMDADMAAEKVETEAKAIGDPAMAKRDAAKKRAAEAAKRSAPRDTTITVYSTPIKLIVAATPKKDSK